MESTPYTETEEQIFEAALDVFSCKGKDGARMQEIADRAGINKAMLHYYFRSKDGLYEAVFDYVFSRLMRALHGSLTTADSFETFLRTFIDRYVDFHRAHPAVMRLWIHENMVGAPVMRRKIEEKREIPSPPRLFAERMQAAIDAGEIRAVDPIHTFMTLLGGSVFFFLAFPAMSALHPPLADDVDATIEARKQHLFDLIYHGLQPRPDAE